MERLRRQIRGRLRGGAIATLTAAADTAVVRMKAVTARQVDRLRSHAPVLSQLWLTGITVSGLNFISTLLIVSKTSAEQFAGYTLALSVMTVAGGLADGGLASTFGALAVASPGEGSKFREYQRIYRRYAVVITPVGIAVGISLAALIAARTKVPLGSGAFVTLAGFVTLGGFTAYTTQTGAFLYARGLFREYNKTQSIGAASRAVLLCAAVFLLKDFDLRRLFILTAIPIVIAAAFASRYAKATAKDQQVPTDPMLAAEVRQFLLPTGVALILNAITFQVTALGGSFYAPSAAIATYGVFMRGSQIVTMLFTPAASYGIRQIRLTDSPQRRQQETRLLGGLIASYSLYAGGALAAYMCLGLVLKHYALGHTLEYAVFLAYCGLGSIQSWMDGILGARSYARHRIIGTLVLCSVNIVLLPLARPQTLRALVLIDLVSMSTIVLYYAQQLRAARRLTENVGR
jgi:hypothetical protein